MDVETLNKILDIIKERKRILDIDIKHSPTMVDSLKNIARVNELNLLEIEILKMKINLY